MKNGNFHETGRFAPETAVGTGAAEPLVDEYVAAENTPSVDEHTLDDAGGKSQNGPETDRHVEYSGDDSAESASNGEKSTGEDYETRNKDDDSAAGASVDSVITDDQVNAKAEDVRPEAPQATKVSRKAKSTV